MPLDLSVLAQDVRDIIEMREALEPTFGNFITNDYSSWFWDMLRQRADPNVEHSVLISVTGLQGSGKSLSSISMCCFMDPDFSEKNLFFKYDDLVRDRSKIRPNSAVLVDEQSTAYGLDSHRVMIVLAQMKEQLRKKSIHFFFCAPVLYEESKTSMYILETMFIDRESMEVYAALKTREGLVLGHVRIPHPLKPLSDGKSLATPQLMNEYQKKKDEHLESVLGQKNVDSFEERAKMICENDLFKRAEKIYKSKYGYMPQSMILQIINKTYPELNAGVMTGEIAQRIKFNKEVSGEWDMPGRMQKNNMKGRKK